jgi:HK97 family phage prohead protease
LGIGRSGGTAEFESKQARVEAKALNDAEGTVEAVVSVTNIVDSVNDVIEPGAYSDTLKKRIPKGVWSHDTTIPVARTLTAIELEPGDDRLPTHLKAIDAGGVLVKMQFNLNTTRGREAYEDIKFFGGEQEWSIGYSVPEGGSEMKGETGIRHIKRLEWYEYSPVLFGAAPGTATVSVKEIPIAETVRDEPEEEKGPIASHAVGFADDRPWKPAMYKNVRSPADKAYYSKIFAYLEKGEDPDYKTNYSFIHHYVSSDGSPGAAALGGLREGIGSLNGARGGTKLRGSDRKGVYSHLARHYRESGEKPLDLKSDEYLTEIMELKASLSGFDFEEIDALIEEGAEITEIKSTLEDIMANDAENTETTETEVADTGVISTQSVINEAITALNTLSARLADLEEKGGDAPGFSNTEPDSSERAEGAGTDAPEVVADLSHGGTLTPEQMAVEGSPAGGDAKPAKKPKAEAAPAEEAEKADEATEETTEEAPAEDAKADTVGLNLSELREFHDLITYSDLGE